MFMKSRLPMLAVLACLTALPLPASAHEDDAKQECMTMVMTGNPDVDFVKNMIPHHKMAIDMAEKELDKGKDAEARAMAQKVIDAQKKEISEMKAWLKEHKAE